MAESVAKPFYDALVDHGAHHEEVVVVTNDLTASCEADGFRDRFPERHISAGMAEQALVAAMSGLSGEGLYPIFASFAVFCTRRPYEQVALTLAYPARKATMVGFLPGVTTPGGVTHQAVDDIGLMTALPNMTVLEAADATDMETILEAVHALPGPAYIRGLRGEVPRLFDEPFTIGQHRTLIPGEKVLVVVSGHLTGAAFEVVSALSEKFPGLGLINVGTLKPFSDAGLAEAISRAERVVTVENHWLASGLHRQVLGLVSEIGAATPVHAVGIPDTFTHGGSAEYLEDFYGIGARHIELAILRSLGEVDASPSHRGRGSQGLTRGVAEGL